MAVTPARNASPPIVPPMTAPICIPLAAVGRPVLSEVVGEVVVVVRVVREDVITEDAAGVVGDALVPSSMLTRAVMSRWISGQRGFGVRINRAVEVHLR